MRLFKPRASSQKEEALGFLRVSSCMSMEHGGGTGVLARAEERNSIAPRMIAYDRYNEERL